LAAGKSVPAAFGSDAILDPASNIRHITPTAIIRNGHSI